MDIIDGYSRFTVRLIDGSSKVVQFSGTIDDLAADISQITFKNLQHIVLIDVLGRSVIIMLSSIIEIF